MFNFNEVYAGSFFPMSFLRNHVVKMLFHASRSFIVLASVLKSVVHLELICVCGVRTGPLTPCEYPVIPSAFVEKTVPIGLLWCLVQKSSDPIPSVGLECVCL